MLAYLVDAFTDQRFEGNRAGVVFDADHLTRKEKQMIASEIGASETAFVSRSSVADFKVDFFTPTTQIDFCGHATIATFYMLGELDRVELLDGVRDLTQETKAGVMPVSISRKHGRTVVSMKQRRAQFATPAVSPAEMAQALNIDVEQLDLKFPLALANTANWHLLVAVSSREVLDGIEYDAARLSQILSKYEAVTAHVFCAGRPGLFYARNFGPTIGIPEDPATGSAAGAFAAYLGRERHLNEGSNELQIIQGEAMRRPSRLTVNVTSRGGEVEDLQVSGTAVLSFTLSTEASLVVRV